MGAIVMKTKIRIKSSLKHFFYVFNNERGISIPLTLVIMAVLLVITGAFTNVVTYETRETAKFRQKIQAFYIADGAIERGVNQLNQVPTWRSGWSNSSLGAGGYTLTVTPVDDDGDGDFDENDNGAEDRLRVTARATVGGSTRRVSRHVNEIPNIVPPFNFAAFAKGSLSVSKVASYNSNTQPVPTDFSLAGSDGDIGTNSNAVDAITVQTSGSPPKVKGDATVGPGSNSPSTVISGESHISGSLGQNSSQINLPAPMLPAPGTYTYIANITATDSPLAAGTYVTESISLSGNDILTTTGAVKIYVKNANGLADAISISGNASARGLDLKPANLSIYCTDAVTGVKIAGNGSIYGTIYAPNANIQLNGTGTTEFMVAGSLVGNTVNTSGSRVTIYYDTALYDNSSGVNGLGAAGYSRAACWWEGQ